MKNMKNINCLFDRGTKCSILKTRKCSKCKFFKEDTEENRNKYIENINSDIKKYAEQHK